MQKKIKKFQHVRSTSSTEKKNFIGSSNRIGGSSSSSRGLNIHDPYIKRSLWHSILREHGRYSSHAIFLLLPSDKEAIGYFKEFGKELDLLSGKECLVLAFSKSELKSSNFNDDIWSRVAKEHITEGVSIQIARMFKIDFTQFPCLIVFKDIRSNEHVVIDLKDCSSEMIAKIMRKVFSRINEAVSRKQDPIRAVSLMRKEEDFQKKGSAFVSEIKSVAGKTLETVLEAFFKASVGEV